MSTCIKALLRGATLAFLLIPLPAQAPHPYTSDRPLDRVTIFAEGIISTGDNELTSAFTPDGKSFYFTKSTPDRRSSFMSIVVSRFEKGRWSQPDIASFSGQYADVDPFVSAGGQNLFFISRRPVSGITPRQDHDIWMVSRKDSGWSEPRHLPSPINTDANEYYPVVTSSGTLYFASDRKGGKGGADLYRSRLVNGKYTEPENLGGGINSEDFELDAYVSPDEAYIILVSYNEGNGDLCISFNDEGSWTPAKNLGPIVNSSFREYCPMVSPDGKYLFFTSERGLADAPREKPLSYGEWLTLIRSPRNGLGDIYQIELDALGFSLRKSAAQP